MSTTAEISPPLSFVLSWLTTRVGLDIGLVRLPALVAGIGTIPLVYAVGVRTVGRGAALLAAALTTLSPFMIYYSAEARPYGVLMALVLLSTLTLLLATEEGRHDPDPPQVLRQNAPTQSMRSIGSAIRLASR